MKNFFYSLTMLLCVFACSDDEPFISQEWQQPEIVKFYKGTTIAYGRYLERHHGAVFQEDGVKKDLLESMKDHGANMIRLGAKMENPSVPNESLEYPIDIFDWKYVEEEMIRAKQLDIEVVLTILSDGGQKAPDKWLNLSKQEMEAEVYQYVYQHLDELGSKELLPAIVAVGNETNSTFCYYNTNYDDEIFKKEALPHGIAMMNQAFKAIDDINAKYKSKVKKLIHFAGPQNLEWCMNHWLGQQSLNKFDIVGLSYYPGMNHTLGKFQNFAHLSKWLWLKYRRQLLVLETSAAFSMINADSKGQIATIEIPGYDISPEGQRRWLEDLAQDVADGEGLGVIYWGADWVAKDVFVFPEFQGSTWEDKTFWTSEKGNDVHELHEGIDWMKRDYLKSDN